MKTRYPECEKCLGIAGWAGMAVSAVNAILKFYIGFVGGSKGVIADALHSTVCIVSNITIIIARSISKKDHDPRFPYGYGKVEFVSSAAVSGVILTVVTVFVISSIKAIINGQYTAPHFSTVVITVVSIISNEIVFQFMYCVGKQYNSPAITAGAWANRSDSFSSIAVLIGIIATMLGMKHMDSIMALVVAAIIYKIIGTNFVDSIKGLMDISSGESLVNRLKVLLKDFPEIKSVTSLKTRSMGQYTKVDLFVNVPHDFTVEQTDDLEGRITRLFRRKEHTIGDLVIGFACEKQDMESES